MKHCIAVALATLLAAATPAFANHDNADGTLNARQHRLEQRVEYGWRSGELTGREYRRLSQELREIDRAERIYRADGLLSPRERRDLRARLDDLSRDIYRETRDVERRHGSYNYDNHAERRF
jgi:hypothetical protein